MRPAAAVPHRKSIEILACYELISGIWPSGGNSFSASRKERRGHLPCFGGIHRRSAFYGTIYPGRPAHTHGDRRQLCQSSGGYKVPLKSAMGRPQPLRRELSDIAATAAEAVRQAHISVQHRHYRRGYGREGLCGAGHFFQMAAPSPAICWVNPLTNPAWKPTKEYVPHARRK